MKIEKIEDSLNDLRRCGEGNGATPIEILTRSVAVFDEIVAALKSLQGAKR